MPKQPNPSKGARRSIHLVANAHLDPVWQWEWPEGAAAAISTFRCAADFCEEFEGFVFNHNEAILYEWVREYEPALFERIQKLAAAGRWFIMGGWYLQPDCNLPSSESFIRQILLGRTYFKHHFNQAPTTAINFDSFGHSRGLVQILSKSGYDSYLFCRPQAAHLNLPGDNFIWIGYDGSEVLACRQPELYFSHLGQAAAKVMNLQEKLTGSPILVLWGVGNHGGGPSRADLQALNKLAQAQKDKLDIYHSTPEAYFYELRSANSDLPRYSADLNPWAVGCYTSQARIKQRHRQLENELLRTEKMLSTAWAQYGMPYPQEEMLAVQRDLAFIQFHDILPGTSIQAVEDAALQQAGHGLDILTRLRTRAFFQLAQEQAAATENKIPILAYNPHPFPIHRIIECELMLSHWVSWERFTNVELHRGDATIPAQLEKEESNLNLDWRKRIVFKADLLPMSMGRFDCIPQEQLKRPTRPTRNPNQPIRIQNDQMDVQINPQTGLIDHYRIDGVDLLAPNACCPLVIQDDPNPWGFEVLSFRQICGAFQTADSQENQQISGVLNPGLPPVRIIEEGLVRTVVEAILTYHHSSICLRYKIPLQGSEIEIEARVYWNEKDKMLKLTFPTPLKKASCLRQVAGGIENTPSNGHEMVFQKWAALASKEKQIALSVINDRVYGMDYQYGEIRFSLLRSPAYCCHPIDDRPLLPDDRMSPRVDQGEHIFRFWLNGGTLSERLARIDREALTCNEPPLALSFFPSGANSGQTQPFIILDDPCIQMQALKKAADSDEIILRLFEPTGTPRSTHLKIPSIAIDLAIKLTPFELRTYKINLHQKTCETTDLLEQRI